MDSLREKLRKAAGLFVDLPPEQRRSESYGATEEEPAHRAMTVEQLVKDSEGPNLDEITVPAASELPPVAPDGPADFAAIYAQAGLPAAPFTAEQAVEMLKSLPGELPLAMQRQTMTVALNAMGRSIGATPETIVADASRKLAALTAYTDNLSRQTSQTIVAAEDEIKALQVEIEAKRQEIAAAQQRLANAVSVCHAESDRLDDVLEFFSLDVPPSKHSPAESGSQGS